MAAAAASFEEPLVALRRQIEELEALPEGGRDKELERLRAENERLKKRSSKGVTMKVSEKGALSVYGLGRFPVTLYKEQWQRLLDMADDIRSFIEENQGTLKSKD